MMRRFTHPGQILRRTPVLGSLAAVPTEPKTLMTQTRKSRGLSLEVVAAKVKTDPTNLSRVEKGQQMPKRELARALFRFYGGSVPLSAIYDPEFHAETDAA
jgi:ribosome-binding protein aMBF1 (putative translation factor)